MEERAPEGNDLPPHRWARFNLFDAPLDERVPDFFLVAGPGACEAF